MRLSIGMFLSFVFVLQHKNYHQKCNFLFANKFEPTIEIASLAFSVPCVHYFTPTNLSQRVSKL